VETQLEEVALVQAQWAKQKEAMRHRVFAYLFGALAVTRVDLLLPLKLKSLKSGIALAVVGLPEKMK
jgi:hypothetical protein